MSKGSNVTSTQRLKQDYLRLKRDPVPYITAEPSPANILEWHYVVKGPTDSPYAGGFYHGKLIFPKEYPFKPPGIVMTTPNGRFKCNTRLCLSISDFHPDTWNPAWSVSTILTGLLSFMLEKSPTLGSIETTDFQKRQFALHSGPFNLRDKTFCEIFPDVVKEISDYMKQMESGIVQNTNVNAGNNSAPNIMEGEGLQNAMPNGALTNLVVIVSFAAFAWTVQYIISSIQ